MAREEGSLIAVQGGRWSGLSGRVWDVLTVRDRPWGKVWKEGPVAGLSFGFQGLVVWYGLVWLGLGLGLGSGLGQARIQSKVARPFAAGPDGGKQTDARVAQGSFFSMPSRISSCLRWYR